VPLRPPAPPALPPESLGVLWAFVPFLSLGFGTPFSFLYGAVRSRSWRLGAAGVAYGGASAVVTTGTALAASAGEAGLVAIGVLLATVLWIVGTVHAVVVRPAVYPRTSSSDRVNQHAIGIAKHRRALREQARTLATEDPALAVELRIGRPDIPRRYDDGGLIDVNHAPAPTLALLPGMSDDLVERIVQVREEQGGFVSVEELAVDVDLPPDLVQRIAEYTIFI
jgi:DNA uptake protein ComE-like DNA-binding protein